MFVESCEQLVEVVDTALEGVGSTERRFRELYIMKRKGIIDDVEQDVKQSQQSLTGSATPAVSNPKESPPKPSAENFQRGLFNAIRKGESEFNNFLAKQQKIEVEHLKTMGLDGWYPIHYAINYSNKTAIKYICNICSDLNQITRDGYTVLMLCAQKKSLEFFKLILDTNKVDVNTVTSKGSILHFLYDNDLKQFLPLLQNARIDPNLTDQQGRMVKDVVSNPILLKMIMTNHETLGNLAGPKKKPSGAKGTIFKTGNQEHILSKNNQISWIETGNFFRNLKSRFLELNTNERCLIRYESRADAPNKPIEITSLKDITSVKCVTDKMFLQSGLFYFEVTDSAASNLYATKSQQTTLKWVQMINNAVDYAMHYERILSQSEPNGPTAPTADEHAEMIDFDQTGSFRAPSTAAVESVKKSVMQISVEILNGVFKILLSVLDNNDSGNNSLKQSFTRANVIEYHPRICHFEIIRKLGQGNFGVVYKVKFTPNQKIYAMKVLPKKNVLTNKMLKYAQAEANILRKNSHPLVLSLYFSFQTPTNLYMVIDCCSDKTLESLITEKDKFSEEEARFYLAEIIVAIEYVHSIGVLYRDMKPENILIALDGHIMLADFGLSKENVAKNELAKSFLGSPIYLAPEMVTGQGFTQSSDLYAIGIVFYEMLFGEDPYHTNDKLVLFERIRVNLKNQILSDGNGIMGCNQRNGNQNARGSQS